MDLEVWVCVDLEMGNPEDFEKRCFFHYRLQRIISKGFLFSSFLHIQHFSAPTFTSTKLIFFISSIQDLRIILLLKLIECTRIQAEESLYVLSTGHKQKVFYPPIVKSFF
ncbi:hypothetical protein WN944_006927 [Citrus x changshan-huyou]|uniref:Uncharacterized protein n=1 Tax=Citrus x changshan-huyou TaxID=2935761 RepID=A0AAP0MPW0_9ROSI